MSSQHTPGPWEITSRQLTMQTVTHKGNDICDVWNLDADRLIDSEQMEANARLIAAAPELLDALIAISTNPHINLGDLVYNVREAEGEGWDGPAVSAWSDACEQVKAAIAKAKGEAL